MAISIDKLIVFQGVLFCSVIILCYILGKNPIVFYKKITAKSVFVICGMIHRQEYSEHLQTVTGLAADPEERIIFIGISPDESEWRISGQLTRYDSELKEVGYIPVIWF